MEHKIVNEATGTGIERERTGSGVGQRRVGHAGSKYRRLGGPIQPERQQGARRVVIMSHSQLNDLRVLDGGKKRKLGVEVGRVEMVAVVQLPLKAQPEAIERRQDLEIISWARH
jgi:hypothetical protein